MLYDVYFRIKHPSVMVVSADSEDEAKEAFRQLIYECLDAKSQTVNDMIHDLVHYK